MKSLNNDNEIENFGCDICGLTNIHKNDYENHLNSRKHKSNKRNAENCNNNDISYDCQYCHVKLTDVEFYKIHKNTKAHRKNVRKWKLNNGAEEIKPKVKIASSNVDSAHNFKAFRISVLPNESATNKADETSSLGPETPTMQPSEFTRQKYKTRSSLLEENFYKSYTISLAAYVSLKLTLDPGVDNFHISFNDKEFLSFGDLVVRITRKDKHTIYAIKCKQVSNSFKQISSLNEAKVILEKEYINVEMFRRHPELNFVKFSIFTTANTTSNFCETVPITAATLNKWKTCTRQFDDGASLLVRPFRKNVVVNVSTDPENVFSFALNESIEAIALPNIWFFSSQRLYPQMLNDLLKKYENYPDIGKEYTKYIENWADGKLGGNYKLTKRDVVLKLGYLLLEKFTIAPKLINLPQSNFDHWNQVMEKVDLIVVKNDPFIISKMCQPINRTIEEVFGVKIDTVSRTIDINGKITNDTDPVLKAYLFEEIGDLKEETPLVKIYKVFWRWGKIPLLMNTEGNEDAKNFILETISMMKQNGLDKKFLLKTSQPNSVKQRDDLRIFTSLSDIKDLVDLDRIHIKISDNFKISVKEIDATDPFFLKWAGPAVFFDMTLEKYSFKVSNARTGSIDDEDQLKIILSEEMRQAIEANLYETSGRMGNLRVVERLRGINPLALKL